MKTKSAMSMSAAVLVLLGVIDVSDAALSSSAILVVQALSGSLWPVRKGRSEPCRYRAYARLNDVAKHRSV